jgi:hypothetical protein
MAFLKKEELKTVADMAIIDIITNLDEDIVSVIIDESIDKMRGFLGRFYDVNTLFSATGEARKKSLVKRLKDIVIYEIYERYTRDTNAVAARRYAEAMDWLEKSYTGELGDATLPSKPEQPADDTGFVGDIRFGGNKKYKSEY